MLEFSYIILSLWCPPGLLLYFYLLLFEVGLKETIKDKWCNNLFAFFIVVIGGWSSLISFWIIKRTSAKNKKSDVEENN